MLEELKADYFSLGSYVMPWQPVDQIRPPLRHNPDSWLSANAPDRNNIPQEFVDKFDIIIVMHVPEWIINNWDKFKGKRVIWRTIGQSSPSVEAKLAPYRSKGLEVVRYSKRESNIAGNIGCDALIPFYKDENEFKGWVGGGNEVITFAQNMEHRGEYCNFQAFKYITEGIPAKVYGPKNEQSGELNGGYLTYDGMKQKMRDGKVYVYTGTQPASYTLNFIEAWMTGIPTVAVGPKYGNSLNIAGDLYQIPDLISNAVNGFWSDDLNECRKYVRFLLNDRKSAERIGMMGRFAAIQMFGMEKIKELWRSYLQIKIKV